MSFLFEGPASPTGEYELPTSENTTPRDPEDDLWKRVKAQPGMVKFQETKRLKRLEDGVFQLPIDTRDILASSESSLAAFGRVFIALHSNNAHMRQLCLSMRDSVDSIPRQLYALVHEFFPSLVIRPDMLFEKIAPNRLMRHEGFDLLMLATHLTGKLSGRDPIAPVYGQSAPQNGVQDLTAAVASDKPLEDFQSYEPNVLAVVPRKLYEFYLVARLSSRHTELMFELWGDGVCKELVRRVDGIATTTQARLGIDSVWELCQAIDSSEKTLRMRARSLMEVCNRHRNRIPREVAEAVGQMGESVQRLEELKTQVMASGMLASHESHVLEERERRAKARGPQSQ